MKFEELQKQVLEWAEEKNLLHEENAEKQFMKFIEEVFEFYKELISYKETCNFFNTFGERYDDDAGQEYMELEMGDIFVTLIILCKQLDIDSVECLDLAYRKIKGRNGKAINGTWKEEHLKFVPEVYRQFAVELDEEI